MKLLILVTNQKLRRPHGHHNFGIQLSKVEGLAGGGSAVHKATPSGFTLLGIRVVNKCIFRLTKLNYTIAFV